MIGGTNVQFAHDPKTGRSGLGFAKDFNKKSKEELLNMMRTASSERHFQMYEALRKAAIKYKVPYITTLAGANMTVKGIAAAKKGHGEVKSLQEYHASIEEI